MLVAALVSGIVGGAPHLAPCSAATPTRLSRRSSCPDRVPRSDPALKRRGRHAKQPARAAETRRRTGPGAETRCVRAEIRAQAAALAPKPAADPGTPPVSPQGDTTVVVDVPPLRPVTPPLPPICT